VRAFIGTQADKLNDAVEAMLKLMNDMPQADAQFEGAKTSALKVIASTRITKENIYWSWDAAQRRGLDYDVRKHHYERIPGIDMAAMKAFFDRGSEGPPVHLPHHRQGERHGYEGAGEAGHREEGEQDKWSGS
jgi:zinc protease